MHILAQECLCQLFHIVNLSYSDQGETTQMAVHQHRLRIGITDDTDTTIPHETVKLGLKTSAEIGILQIMDAAIKAVLNGERGHTGTFGAKMGLIVCTIKQVSITLLLRDNAKKTTHNEYTLM